MMVAPKPDIETVGMTDGQKRARRNRSIALGVVLALFVVIIYVATWAKFGAAILQRPM